MSRMEEASLWETLVDTAGGRPIYLYGTGDGGDKILSALEQYHIPVAGVFASDGFVRNRTFHGMKVRSYGEVAAGGEDFVILVAFGSTLPEVAERIAALDRRHTLFLPDVPLYGGSLFDGRYFSAHRGDLEALFPLFADDRSREVLSDAVNFRLSGKLRYLQKTDEPAAVLRELFSGQVIRTAVDGGAYKGDSARVLFDALSPAAVVAVEPDERTYRKLSAYAEEETRGTVIPVHAALWEDDGASLFSSSASRGASLREERGENRTESENEEQSAGSISSSFGPSLSTARNRQCGRGKRHARTVLTPCRRLDGLFSEGGVGFPSADTVDFLKLDVEGAEAEALAGAKKLLLREEPNLAVSLYHRTDDLITLPRTVHALLPRHRLYLRRAPCIPLWDLTLYAVRDK